jgi:hypothetical protein
MLQLYQSLFCGIVEVIRSLPSQAPLSQHGHGRTGSQFPVGLWRVGHQISVIVAMFRYSFHSLVLKQISTGHPEPAAKGKRLSHSGFRVPSIQIGNRIEPCVGDWLGGVLSYVHCVDPCVLIIVSIAIRRSLKRKNGYLASTFHLLVYFCVSGLSR